MSWTEIGINHAFRLLSFAHKAQQINMANSSEGPRDPRFDPRCSGSNDVRHFIKNYSFLQDLRRQELSQLERALKREPDPEKKKDIQKTISRIRNKLRSLEDKTKELELVRELKSKFKNVQKSLIKKSLIVNKFSELKRTGKLNKYLERKRKRLIHKDRK